MNPLEAFLKKGSTWTLYGPIWAHWKTYLASYRLVIFIAQAQSKRTFGGIASAPHSPEPF